MDTIVAIILLCILFGCQVKVPYSTDGVKHELVINPSKEKEQ